MQLSDWRGLLLDAERGQLSAGLRQWQPVLWQLCEQLRRQMRKQQHL
jgi:hypothetical protein